jgi:hypothetical protein
VIKMDQYTKRELATLVVGMFIAAVLTLLATYYTIQFFVADPNDPLTKAGGLKPDQTITKPK